MSSDQTPEGLYSMLLIMAIIACIGIACIIEICT